MLLHLSDIHITGDGSDVIGTRCEEIVDAIKNVDYALDMCVVVLTGDVAYSGKEEQYLRAIDFLDQIGGQLSEKLSSKSAPTPLVVNYVVVPGNHDCDFSLNRDTRDPIIRSILDDPSKSRSAEIVDVCTGVQTPFFEFLTAMETPTQVQRTAMDTGYSKSLAYSYSFSCEGEGVKFLCFNTAWVSQLRETQGRLYFPPEAVNDSPNSENLTVAVFHHPYNWIESNAAREFRNRVEANADLILTGHEHVPSIRSQDRFQGWRNICVEGGVLQDSRDPGLSEFNVFVFDTTNCRLKYGQYGWGRDGYRLSNKSLFGEDGGGLEWVDYRQNEYRRFDRFRVSREMQDHLDDPGISIRHQDRGTLRLQDVFEYPDLVEIAIRGEVYGRRIAGSQVRNLLSSEKRLLITGDNESGKTSLSKRLFEDLLDDGYVPVLLDGAQDLPWNDRIYGYIERKFEEQYNSNMLDAYRKLNRSSKAIIIDDYDKISLTSIQKKEILSRLSQSNDCLIIFSHDITSDLDQLTSPGVLFNDSEQIHQYRIQPLGYVGRDRLIERWMLLGNDADPADAAFVRHLTRTSDTLNTLVGRNFVPPYPMYVLSVLQALDAATPIDLSASTHGYFYELFIKASIARGRSSADFDIIASYLAYVSYRLHQGRTFLSSDTELRKIHEDYENQYDIRRSYESVKNQLISQNIWTQINDGVRFKYAYLYNYFVASYIRDHITETEIRKTITEMSRGVHIEGNANILMFLAHLSKDPVVIEELLSASKERFSGYTPTNLVSDIGFLSELGASLPQVVYEEQDPRANREAMLAKMDRDAPPDDSISAPPIGEEEVGADIDDPVVQFIAALRHLEILGQVLKNFPGSLEGSVKRNIAQECYDLGLRSLSVVFEMIQSEQTEIVAQISEELRKRHPGLTTHEIDRRAQQTLTGLAHALSYGMVRKIGRSVGSRELSNTFERLLRESPTPSYRLINSSLELDYNPDFPAQSIRTTALELGDKPLPLSVLRHLVISHFHLFPVKFRTKQSICASLDIKYSSLQRSDPSPRMLPRYSSPSSPST